MGKSSQCIQLFHYSFIDKIGSNLERLQSSDENKASDVYSDIKGKGVKSKSNSSSRLSIPEKGSHSKILSDTERGFHRKCIFISFDINLVFLCFQS